MAEELEHGVPNEKLTSEWNEINEKLYRKNQVNESFKQSMKGCHGENKNFATGKLECARYLLGRVG